MMDDSNQILEGKLVESIKIEGLGGLAQECSELGLDLITNDGILKDIPIVGTIVNLSKAVGSFRDLLYLKKLLSFLQKIGETTQQQREKFIEDNCQNVRRFEETVLLVLEQANRIEKSSLIGKIFKACILGALRYEDAVILSEMVNKAFWGDLQAMFDLKEYGRQSQSLFMSGLFEMIGKPLKSIKDDSFAFRKNDYGYALSMIYAENYDELKESFLGIKAKGI